MKDSAIDLKRFDGGLLTNRTSKIQKTQMRFKVSSVLKLTKQLPYFQSKCHVSCRCDAVSSALFNVLLWLYM